ncbi:MAG: molybdopterin-dependent oxidoreductase [Xanthobacteraceae bacterium]|nr:molybdopterin-dependent oxidoreductase [Xanthobacteraceae bacterium]
MRPAGGVGDESGGFPAGLDLAWPAARPGFGGFAGRRAVTAGNAVHLAAQAVREKALQTAALLLDVPQLSLDIRDGSVFATGKNLSPSLRDIADTLAGALGNKFPAGLGPSLEAAALFARLGQGGE